MSGPAARAEGVTKVYGWGDTRVTALDNLSIEFDQGVFTAVMGPSGSGKSTLMHCMAGLDSVTNGSVFIGDMELSNLNDRQLTKLRREQIGFIFQAFNLVPTLTARENITLPLDLAGSKVDHSWFDSVVEVLGLEDRLKHRPTELSGGQQQRVAAARAMVSRPELIFADEPSGNLDSRSSTDLLTFLQQAVQDHAQTIVMVTHDATAAGYADSVVFLSDGKVVDTMDGPTPERVLDRLKSLEY
ncbi:MAG: ABC transporter ATP-binding protein [Acidimicrobiia bacterium]|nr:ABC transporter ATP-binding protein [bacterium]MXX64593.1 ABC transporter ATP-binding protein [Acidimicrobiia bacterium]MCY3580556.1 ABC transporter ATP-binding protein [bacterium]MCY3651814.1 ABC transporter ATP-binding protein [bacterium]MDE0642741.1 ABC transporter ATP-binding protein [bacterium]